MTPISNEFRPNKPPLLSLAQNIGLLAGAMFWGFGCDVFGRRWAFNLTLGVTGVFGLISASSPNFAAIGCFAALWSFGVGGNLPGVTRALVEESLSLIILYQSTPQCSWSFCLAHINIC